MNARPYIILEARPRAANLRRYLQRRREIGAPVADEERFLSAADHWDVVSALLAAEWFQARSEGRGEVKPEIAPELLQHARFRDDVLADAWAISRRRPELHAIAAAMEQCLPPEVCQERHLRGKPC